MEAVSASEDEGFSAQSESHFIDGEAWDEQGTMNPADIFGTGACKNYCLHHPNLFDWEKLTPEDILEHVGEADFGKPWGKSTSGFNIGELLEGVRVALVGQIMAQRQAKILAIDLAAGRELNRGYFRDKFREDFIQYAFHANKLLWRQRLKSSLQFENLIAATKRQMMFNAGVVAENWRAKLESKNSVS